MVGEPSKSVHCWWQPVVHELAKDVCSSGTALTIKGSGSSHLLNYFLSDQKKITNNLLIVSLIVTRFSNFLKYSFHSSIVLCKVKT